MAFFAKNTQSQPAVKSNDAAERADETTLEQLETQISDLVGKVKLFNEKNQRFIRKQNGKLESLKRELQALESQKFADEGNLQKAFQPYGGNQVMVPQLRKTLEERNQQISAKQLEIKQVELDISILERTRDEESIKALVHVWKDYEIKMFSEFITPLEVEITAAKAFYFEKLKQLRNRYTQMEGIIVHLEPGVIGNESINVYNWINEINSKPQLLITKDDEIKELTITTTYRAE